MIRKVSILLIILILTAAFAFAQTAAPAQSTCNCLESGQECSCPGGSCCKPAEQKTSAPSRTEESAVSTAPAGRTAEPAVSTAPAGRTEESAISTAPAGRTEEAAVTSTGRTAEPAVGSSRTEEAAVGSGRTAEAAVGSGRTAESAVTDKSEEADMSDEEIISHIPESIRYNEYYQKSIELSKQAQEAYDSGFYDGSIALAEEAVYYAQLSDIYVTEQLIAEAKRLMDWADNNNIETRYPNLYHASKEYYGISLEAQENSELKEANIAAINVIEILGPMADGKPSHLPSRYTVRSWRQDRDCLWNIAGYPFVYGDPWKWRILYEANKSRMPFPNNPNIIEPGFILDIPNLPGENRSGMCDPHSR